MEQIPQCSECGMIMFKERNRDSGIIYWQCKKKCKFHIPVFPEKLSKNEEKFIKSLTKE